jgi:hypothetical protein
LNYYNATLTSIMRNPLLSTILLFLLLVNFAAAASFRVPDTDELPKSSEGVKKALVMLRNKETGSALKQLKELAAAGDAEGQFILGLCYQYG